MGNPEITACSQPFSRLSPGPRTAPPTDLVFSVQLLTPLTWEVIDRCVFIYTYTYVYKLYAKHAQLYAVCSAKNAQ